MKPKPKLSKAQRKELQEKQRAAKAARLSSERHGAATSSSRDVKTAQGNVPSASAMNEKASAQVRASLCPRPLSSYCMYNSQRHM